MKNWLISKGVAAPHFPTLQENYYSFLLMLGGMGLIFYFLILRPQNQRIKEHNRMIASLTKDDEIMTTGGIVGRITKISDNGYLIISLNNITEIIIKRDFISAILPQGTLKALNIIQ
ncbi:MAG: preprotein translocase subunit YajC [Candidatus Dasytiphilus stammeri]